MTTNQTDTLILKDQAGEYYVLPQAVLERGHVSAEAKAAIEAQIPALQAIGAGDDAQGHLFVACAILGAEVTLAGFMAGRLLGGSNLGPLIRAYAGL